MTTLAEDLEQLWDTAYRPAGEVQWDHFFKLMDEHFVRGAMTRRGPFVATLVDNSKLSYDHGKIEVWVPRLPQAKMVEAVAAISTAVLELDLNNLEVIGILARLYFAGNDD